MRIALTLVTYFLLIVYTHYDYILLGKGRVMYPTYIAMNLCTVMLDASVMALVAGMVPRKWWRWLVSGVVWLFCMANVIYLRHFDTYVDVTLMGEVRNFDILGESFAALIHFRDFVATALYWGLCYWAFVRLPERKTWFRWWVVLALAVGSFGGIYYCANRLKHKPYTVLLKFWKGKFDSDTYSTGYQRGFIHKVYSDLWRLNMHRGVTDADKEAMASLAEMRAREMMPMNLAPRPDNVVFVVMESIMSEAIGAVCNGDSVMPNLARLAGEAQYGNLNMMSETALGWSADGQLIYMAGILPHTTVTTANAFTHNTHHGLGTALKSLGFATAMVIPTGRHVWHQEEMCHAYGIDSLYNAVPYGNDNDEHLVDTAIEVVRKYKDRPVFLTVLNMSTHTPYSSHFDLRLRDFNDSRYVEQQLLYFERANYFDHHLQRFVDALKACGMWDNTMVVLASDHHDGDWAGRDRLPIPLIITGGYPIAREAHDDALIYQSDVYPTLLGLLGVSAEWRGVGRDIFNATSQRLPEPERHNISNLILETDWFAQ